MELCITSLTDFRSRAFCWIIQTSECACWILDRRPVSGFRNVSLSIPTYWMAPIIAINLLSTFSVSWKLQKILWNIYPFFFPLQRKISWPIIYLSQASCHFRSCWVRLSVSTVEVWIFLKILLKILDLSCSMKVLRFWKSGQCWGHWFWIGLWSLDYSTCCEKIARK